MKELRDVDIRHFKLSSGDEIISFVSKEEDNAVYLNRPFKIHSGFVDANATQYYFTDWLPMSTSSMCALSKLHIVTFVECDNDVKEKYISMCVNESPVTSDLSFVDGDDDEFDITVDDDDTNYTIH